MGASVNKIPSRNLPFTDKEGRINPTWYEYLRKFIADSAETTGSTPAVTSESIVAGAGLRKVTDGNEVTLSVGAGNALAVNADDVSLDINNLNQVQGTLDDEIVISRPTDNNAIRKTKLRDVVGLSAPGGIDSQVQYNDADAFGGDAKFTYNKGGTITSQNLILSGTNADGTTRSNIRFVNITGTYDNKIYWSNTLGAGTENPTSYYISGNGAIPTITGADTTYRFNPNSTGWTFTVGTGNSVVLSAGTGLMTVTGLGLARSTVAGISASTTQTQGQRTLTGDVNEVSICANANDVVTLPGAAAGRYCLVINNGAQTLQVFPTNGDNLGVGLNASTTIVAGSRKMFVAYDIVNWEPVI